MLGIQKKSDSVFSHTQPSVYQSGLHVWPPSIQLRSLFDSRTRRIFHTLRPTRLNIVLFPMLLPLSGILCLMKLDAFSPPLHNTHPFNTCCCYIMSNSKLFQLKAIVYFLCLLLSEHIISMSCVSVSCDLQTTIKLQVLQGRLIISKFIHSSRYSETVSSTYRCLQG